MINIVLSATCTNLVIIQIPANKSSLNKNAFQEDAYRRHITVRGVSLTETPHPLDKDPPPIETHWSETTPPPTHWTETP